MSEPEVTEADREKAAKLMDAWDVDNGASYLDLALTIAAALAAERAKARDVFLAVGQDLQAAALMAPSRDEERAYRDADARIRRAAEESQ